MKNGPLGYSCEECSCFNFIPDSVKTGLCGFGFRVAKHEDSCSKFRLSTPKVNVDE